ncbi:MAG: NADH-dependent [FeFe] hydrogenase, group A6 [Defluviitaleaceae bacterium]|nr:NADH-dependent [FeFe] hydrogenase, group A6 [Defluviitaleaceae bacterium]
MATAEMTKTVTLKINGIEVKVNEGATIMEAARQIGVRIPTLCFMKEDNEIGACRVCVVEVKGAKNLAAACMFPVSEGMEVLVNTDRVRKARKTNVELLLSHHRMDCLSCPRSTNCELQTLAVEYSADQFRFNTTEFGRQGSEVDATTKHLVRDNTKCILCNRCVAICSKQQDVSVIGRNKRGFFTHIGSAFGLPLETTSCIHCGQCVAVCPTAALRERDDTQKVWDALADPDKYVIVAPAPAIRAQVGEMFGMPIGTNVQGKVVAACRMLGFDKVFDIDTAADITIMEEGTEFIDRLKKGGPFPMFTSCCPAWVKYLEYYYPDMLKNHSSCKSPQGIYGTLMKTYYAEKIGVDPKNIFVVTLMPCTAKKFEITRGEMVENHDATDYPDIDVTITGVEFARMIKTSGIDFASLEDADFDPVFGIASGAGHIFGASGGVMEAALRTVSEVMDGKELTKIDFEEVRGNEGIKEATYEIAGQKIKVAAVATPAKVKEVIDAVRRGEKDYHFIEVMGCAGGCVGGGGQPQIPGYLRNELDIPKKRASVLYNIDSGNPKLRKSHENPVVKEIYETFLGEPGGHKSHELLHTKYVGRSVYPTKELQDYLDKE